MADFNAYEYIGRNEVITLSQLTAAATATGAIYLVTQDGKAIFTDILFQVTVAGITTNVVVRLQGSLDNTNWFNLDADEGDETYTTDGTYGIRFRGMGEIKYIRLYFVSEAGGTAATIDCKAKIFGKPIKHTEFV